MFCHQKRDEEKKVSLDNESTGMHTAISYLPYDILCFEL